MATSPMIAAANARPLSRPLTVGAAAIGAGRGADGGGGACRVAVGAAVPGREAAGAAGAAWAADVLSAGAGAAAGAAGPPGGSVGNLIVGAAEGLGGKLMRTVSFLGWTFPVSFFGGTAPVGMLGMFSAIKLTLIKTKDDFRPCQTHNRAIQTAKWRSAAQSQRYPTISASHFAGGLTSSNRLRLRQPRSSRPHCDEQRVQWGRLPATEAARWGQRALPSRFCQG